MTRPALNYSRLEHEALNLDVMRAKLRGLSGLYEDSRVYRNAQRDAALRKVDRHFLAELWDGRDLDDLAALSDDELERAGVDCGALEAAIAETTRLNEIKRRQDAMAAEIAPAAALLDRLRKYAEGTQ